ncbi:thioredoxin family protein [Actinoplanes sp. NPDC051470]|uniref:thioredoxin family protein n=1 Tax=Actinoplanes sp. NPDC051470 TaxID=3157224 RepID=UPI0034309075
MARVLLMFRKDNTPPCGRMVPFVRELVSHARIQFWAIDVVEQPELVEQYNVRSVPTFVIVEDGQPVYTGVGAGCLSELSKALFGHGLFRKSSPASQ